jgi:hypothetical protein
MHTEAVKFKKDWQAAQKVRLDNGVEQDSYVYVHLQEDTGEPFYVGIGYTAGRPWDTDARSDKHKERVAECGIRTHLVRDCVTDPIAKWWEIRWIKALRDAGYDLVNKTLGGDYQPMLDLEVQKTHKANVIAAWDSTERRKNLSENNPMRDPEIVARHAALRRGKSLPCMQGGNHPSARKVIELNSNTVFSSITEAAQHHELSIGGVSAVCRGEQKTTGGMKFCFADEAFLSEHELLRLSAEQACNPKNIYWRKLLSSDELSRINRESWNSDSGTRRRKNTSSRVQGYWDSDEGSERKRYQREVLIGEKSPRATISEHQAQQILDFEGTHAAAARKFGVSYYIAHGIRKRTSWKHLVPTEKS